MIDHNDLLYVSDLNFTTSETFVHYINTTTNDLNSVYSGQGIFPYYKESAIIFEGKYTFIFNPDGSNASNVLQIGGFASVDEETKNTLSIAPSPVLSGGDVSIKVKEQSVYSLLTMDGKIMQLGLLKEGTNTVQLYDIEAGIYLFKINESTERIVIQ